MLGVGVGTSPVLQAAAGVSLTPVDVVMQIGDSNTTGYKNALTDLPTGYYTTDSSVKIWNAAGVGGTANTITTLVPGPMEQQPDSDSTGAATFTNTVGCAGEFIKHYRTDNPSSTLYFFNFGKPGGRFTDAGNLGRAGNFTTTLTDGAYNDLKVKWAAFVAALAVLGKSPNRIGLRFSMGANAVQAAGEAATFDTDMEALIAQMITDGLILSTTKLMFERVSNLQTGLTVANIPTVRTKTENLVLANTTYRELLSADGYTLNADNIHWAAAGHVIMGEQFYYACAGLWYPQKEQTFNGGNPVTHEYRPGDLRNTAGATAFTTTGGNLQTAWDCAVGTVNPTQATDSKRPTISVTNTPNGYGARYATADGATQMLTATSTVGLTANAFGSFAAAQSSTMASFDSLFGEGSSTDGNPFVEPMRSDGTTSLLGLGRDNAVSIFINNVLTTSAFNGTMNFLATYGTNTQWTGRVNGTTGSAQTFTRGAITCDRFALFGFNNNGGEAHQASAKLGIAWFTAAVPDATYLTNARAYCQRRWGTA